MAISTSTSVIPTPSQVTPEAGNWIMSPSTTVGGDEESVRTFRRELTPATGFAFPTPNSGTASVMLTLDPHAVGGPEAYRLSVSPAGVAVTAGSRAGLFYGIQTLKQLLPSQIYLSRPISTTWTADCVTIVDQPRFGWRGVNIDVARHFMPKRHLLRIIDLIAMHKLNTLQLHLTDDQGWRIEIKRYPKLTSVGAFRQDGEPNGSGFYTQDDLREIVHYAAERFITVVPEIEMPGHAAAAIQSYPELGNLDQKLKGTPEWGVNSNILNVNDSTVQFMQNVLSEVMEIFPSKYVHCGGDEVPKDQWKASADAHRRMQELHTDDPDVLQSWFMTQMDAFLTAHGRHLIGWDEILEGGLAPGATVMSWRGTAGGIAAARSGHDVVMAPTSAMYFDYYQGPPSREPEAIGGYLPLETAYAIEPIPSELTADESKHILGVECQLWTEHIRNIAKAEYMLFPRLCAFSEVAWSSPARDFPGFQTRLRAHLPRLDALGVYYRPLDP